MEAQVHDVVVIGGGAAGFERLAHRPQRRLVEPTGLEQQFELHGRDGQLVVRVVQAVTKRG